MSSHQAARAAPVRPGSGPGSSSALNPPSASSHAQQGAGGAQASGSSAQFGGGNFSFAATASSMRYDGQVRFRNHSCRVSLWALDQAIKSEFIDIKAAEKVAGAAKSDRRKKFEYAVH